MEIKKAGKRGIATKISKKGVTAITREENNHEEESLKQKQLQHQRELYNQAQFDTQF